MKLEARDERLLALLGTRARSVRTLAAGLDVPREALADRLAALADNGLVYDLGDGRYERTESGRRVLVTSAGAAIDERIDTSPAVEEAIEGFDLRADEADAVRHAFAFLRYWGEATDEEVQEAVYSEAPAGRETPAAWWDDLVREPLAALPRVEAPTEGDAFWRYAGVPEVDTADADGRRVLSRLHPVYGDAKHALESLEFTDAERAAARAAFRYLYRRGEATEREVREAVYPEYAAGYDSPDDWWAVVIEGAFEALPGVDRENGGAWRYRRP